MFKKAWRIEIAIVLFVILSFLLLVFGQLLNAFIPMGMTTFKALERCHTHWDSWSYSSSQLCDCKITILIFT